MQKCSVVSPSRRPISNLRHATIAAIHRLVTHREERERTSLFYTEGMRFVHQALENRFTRVESVLFARELLTHPFSHPVLEAARERCLPLLEVTPSVYRALSLVEEPQGIAAVVRQRWERLYRIRPDSGLCWLALDTIRSPGNLGTILRTLDSVGGAGLILLGDEIDPYSPEVVRATMGAIFSLRIVRARGSEFQSWRERHRVLLVGTSPHAAEDYCSLSYPESLVLWLGGERKGLSEEQMAHCDRNVCIPMVGTSDSLNVATASAVLLYEVYQQRNGRPPANVSRSVSSDGNQALIGQNVRLYENTVE